MLKKVLLALLGVVAAVVVVVLVLASMKPTAFSVERTATLDAPPSAVYAVVSDLHRFPDWSPWARLDPNLTNTFTGAAGTVGSSYGWRGNDQVGSGKMTIVEARPERLVAIRLDFLAPFAATNHVDWKLTPAGEKTEMAWVMTGNRSFMMKVMCVFMDMDEMVGADFARGLENLKHVVAGH